MHICRLVCGRKLKCGLHTCPEICHRGLCHRCLNTSFDELTCTCGHTVIYPPIPCGTPIPHCPMLCTWAPPCGHTLPRHNCHPESTPCTLCVTLVSRTCMGGHEVRNNIPCHIKDISCGGKCGKPLPCGVHICNRTCHRGACVDDTTPGAPCKQQQCGKKLPLCEHQCKELCHIGRECAVVECVELTKITCHCGRISRQVRCMSGQNRKTLDCDSECEIALRNSVLEEALGFKEKVKNFYSEKTVSLATDELPFVSLAEHGISSLISDPSTGYRIINNVTGRQRQILIELCAYSHVTFTDRVPHCNPHKNSFSASVQKKIDSSMPSVTLTEIVKRAHASLITSASPAPAPQSGQTTVLTVPSASGPAYVFTKTTTFTDEVYARSALLYDLHADVRTPQITEFLNVIVHGSKSGPASATLRDVGYTLKWLDDFSILVTFSRDAHLDALLNKPMPLFYPSDPAAGRTASSVASAAPRIGYGRCCRVTAEGLPKLVRKKATSSGKEGSAVGSSWITLTRQGADTTWEEVPRAAMLAAEVSQSAQTQQEAVATPESRTPAGAASAAPRDSWEDE
eukprot:TRINITY_DN3995_c0_g1_i1.p1 TRINITY_DN3995_c0_g1~~TRINITY_DN3995_c0_g1_i1.p1  ORF type:complete len:570 (-),score=70.93 TRINITY_DN3995_c0_g1_i1:9-1718(-)